MWSPTHIQVTVQRAKDLLIKGKNGTNNCFVTIALGKEKYQTSVKDKAPKNVDWHEECELTIPDQGNRAELILTCLHRNNIGIDEFLGQVTLPLSEMDIYERPRSKWYKLESKPGKEKKKERGEIEARIMFVVKSGSLTDLSKKEKHRNSFSQLASSVGGSLLSIGTIEKRKGIKKFAKSLKSKVQGDSSKKKEKEVKDSDIDFSKSSSSISSMSNYVGMNHGQTKGDADPGVISEDEDEFVFENLSHKSSGSSLNINKGSQQSASPIFKKDDSVSTKSRTLPTSKPPYLANDTQLDEWEAKLYGKNMDIGSTDSLKRRSWETSRVLLPTKEEISEPAEEQTINGKLNVSNKSIVEEKSSDNDNKSEIGSKQSEQNESGNSQPNTAPTTPVSKLKENLPIHHHQPGIKQLIQPIALPRSNTTGNLLESLNKESEKDKADKIEKKRFGKLKYFRRDKHDNHIDSPISNQFGERIIIGHENHILKHGEKIELSKDMLKKYEGKSREEVILMANGLENEVFCQRQRVKELEEYLDNLLLRVMETHPKILQNPYDRNTMKSG